LVPGRRENGIAKGSLKTQTRKTILIAIIIIIIIFHPLTTPKPGVATLCRMLKERCAERVPQSVPEIRGQNETKQNKGWRADVPARTERRC
jgi:hypothetical protein